MIVLLGKSDKKNAELIKLAEFTEVPYICVSLYKKDCVSACTPWNYYAAGGPEESGRPLFWLDLEAPVGWSFRAGDIRKGQICDGDELLANVFFRQPFEDQCIDRIDWVAANGEVYAADYYNEYGSRYAEAVVYNGVETIVSYPARSGRAAVVEWRDTGFIAVHRDHQAELFENQERFYAAFMRDILSERGEKAVLFCEPELSEYISDGCRGILYVQDQGCKALAEQSFRESISLVVAALPGASNALQSFIGEGKMPEVIEVGSLVETSVGGSANDALIVTRSQNIEQLQTLVEGLPEMTFHIAAGTMMAPGLMEFDRYTNVRLYPNSPLNVIWDLMRRCAFYLDINHYLEYDGIVSSALRMNRLVYAFDSTVHQRALVQEEQVYLKEDANRMVSDISRAMYDPCYMQQLLERQRKRIEINGDQKEMLRKRIASLSL